MTEFWLLAQNGTPPTGGNPAQPADTFWTFLFPLLLAFGVFYFLIFRGQRKERQRYADMLANLKRNDRVQTIGGIIGTVVDVRDTEVILKVDETNNVKVRFARSSIKEVLDAEKAPAKG